MLDRKTLHKFGDLVRNYVDADNNFRFMNSTDLKFAYSCIHQVVCLIDKKCFTDSIPEDQFIEWFNNTSDKVSAIYDTNVRLANGAVVFNVVPTKMFVKSQNDKTFLEEISTFAVAVLKTIDGAIIDDWGEDLDEDDDEDPYFM